MSRTEQRHGQDAVSDGDGLADGEDPYPLYAIDERISYRAPDEAGTVPLMRIEDEALRAGLFLDWNEERLTFRCALDRHATLHLYLDGRDDGRWRGADNYEITVDPVETAAKLRVWDARPGCYKFDTHAEYPGGKRLVTEDDLQVECERTGEGYVIPARIAGHELCGPVLRPGATFGVRVEFRDVAGTEGAVVAAFERWRFPVLKLVKQRKGASHVAPQGGFGRPFLDDGREREHEDGDR